MNEKDYLEMRQAALGAALGIHDNTSGLTPYVVIATADVIYEWLVGQDKSYTQKQDA